MKKKNKQKVKIEFTFEAFKAWVNNYKLFSILLSIAFVVIGLTLWDNRPNSMRTPNYVNTKNYNLVEGSYDFTEFHESMTAEKRSSVKDVHFKLEESYCFESNEVTVCVKGYELFETNADVTLPGNYRQNKSKYFLVARIDIQNERSNPIEIKEFNHVYNSLNDSSRAIRDEDFEIPNNLGNIKFENGLILQEGDLYEGIVMYPLSSSAFRQLYFDGSLLVEMPAIYDKSKINTQNIFTAKRELDLPVVEGLIDKHLASVKNLPMDYARRSNGFTTVTSRFTPDVTLTNANGNIEATIDCVESGYFEYRPEYIARRRSASYYQGKKYYRSVKITLRNPGTSTINTRSLMASLELTTNTHASMGYILNEGLNVEPGEAVDLIFSFETRDASSGTLKPGEMYRFILSSENKEVLLEADFKLEQ